MKLGAFIVRYTDTCMDCLCRTVDHTHIVRRITHIIFRTVQLKLLLPESWAWNIVCPYPWVFIMSAFESDSAKRKGTKVEVRYEDDDSARISKKGIEIVAQVATSCNILIKAVIYIAPASLLPPRVKMGQSNWPIGHQSHPSPRSVPARSHVR